VSSTSKGHQTPGAAGIVVLAFVAVLAILALALAAISFASYTTFKEHLDAFASDGDADVSRGDFHAIELRLRLAAVGAALAAATVYWWRRRLARWLAELASSIAASFFALRHGLRSTLANESRLHLGALVVVTLVAVVVRLEFLFQPMRYDESVTYVHYASRPWYIALTTYTAPNNHVLHSELVHLTTAVLGGAEWAIRLPALVAGILLVPATYVAGRALYGRHAGLVGAGLVAASSLLVEYSTNARGYTLLALCFGLLLALGTRLLRTSDQAEWLAFAALGAIGVFTVPVMLYAFGAVATWLGLSFLLAREWRLLLRRLLPSVAAAALLAAIAYAPIVVASGLSSLVDNEFVRSLPWSTFLDAFPESLESVWKGWNRDVWLPVEGALVVGFVAALIFHRRVGRVTVPPALAALAFIAAAVVAQRVVPFERVWLFLLPLYLLTAAAGVLYLLRPLTSRVGGEATAAIVLVLVLAGSLAGNAVATQSVSESEDTSTFRNSEQVAAFLADRLRSGDKILVAPPADAILEYQLSRLGLDPAELLYWSQRGDTARFYVVVKKGLGEYTLAEVLADDRLAGVRIGEPRILGRYEEARVYEIRISA
jgi:dolichyl-phosphate-mannose-protein mannosyltransferase